MAEARDEAWTAPPTTLKGPVPRLTTLWVVENIIHEAWARDDGPLSFEEIKRRMGSRGIRHSTVRTCVDELVRVGKVAVTPSGVMWTLATPQWGAYVRSRKWKPL
ncbi:MAG TPA: hypothetical protein VGR28_08905 [Candidatus Thermoplasmatota archaeon]|jgi:hypothetical protein|nr:hypothetical protein [Candidatus Thermoplasmatota archaeon]